MAGKHLSMPSGLGAVLRAACCRSQGKKLWVAALVGVASGVTAIPYVVHLRRKHAACVAWHGTAAARLPPCNAACAASLQMCDVSCFVPHS